MDPIYIAVIFFVVVMLGAFAGRFARARLPEHHLDADTKDMVKIGVGFLATLAALVLGLVVASAKSAFDVRTQEVQAAAARIIQLDQALARIGPESAPARAMLRDVVASRIGQFSRKDFADSLLRDATGASSPAVRMSEVIQKLAASDEARHTAWARVERLVEEVTQIVTQATAQGGSAIMRPMLVLLGFWFATIMAGWNVISPRNGTTLAVNVLCAVSLAGAILLLLEMDRSFGGLISVSDQPLRAALAHMSAQ
jgi:hypothetical protein